MSALQKRMIPWVVWLLGSLILGSYLYLAMFSERVSAKVFLPGETSHGHYQIELSCTECHDNEAVDGIFTSEGVTNNSCNKCHGDDLAAASDSHPTRKFKNPENAIFLEHIDAMKCTACHTEHQHGRTGEMGVTVPENYCAHCHEVTLENLESHKDLGFGTCATAGCHNYHDNVALAPSFLLKHYGEPDHIIGGAVLVSEEKAPCPEPWTDPIDSKSCRSCHDQEVTDFLKGKHGMRLAVEGLSPMKVGDARSAMKASMAHATLSCTSCHSEPGASRDYVARESCMNCHDSAHTQNYEFSQHSALWQAEVAGGSAGSGVSCATCHMPHMADSDGLVSVQHNQSMNLKPNEKMLREVCINCHGMEFSMSALADENLITTNFVGEPRERHPGVDWTAEAAISRDKADIKAIKAYLDSIGGRAPTHGPRKPYAKTLEADPERATSEPQYETK